MTYTFKVKTFRILTSDMFRFIIIKIKSLFYKYMKGKIGYGCHQNKIRSKPHWLHAYRKFTDRFI